MIKPKLLARSTVISAVIVSTMTIASHDAIGLRPGFAIANTISSATDHTYLVTPDWHTCQQISKTYQEVYAFETSNFYINICQKGDFYFYSGEAKQSNLNSIFIPAHPLENGTGYQAQNGNVSYVVLVPFAPKTSQKSSNLSPTEAILTIKRNEQLVSVESSLDKYCHQSNTAIAFDSIEQSSYNINQIATITDQWDVASDLLEAANYSDRQLLPEIFNSNSRFDFYQVEGELHLLTTCF
jgi:hypothetical protein